MSLANPRVGMYGGVGNARTGVTPGRIAPPPPRPKPAGEKFSVNPWDWISGKAGQARDWAKEQVGSWGNDVAGGMTPRPVPGQPYNPVGAPGSRSPAGQSGTRTGWGGGATPPSTPQSGQSYIDSRNQQAANVFNRGMRNNADADRFAAEARANADRISADAAAAMAAGNYQRANELLTIGEAYNAGIADLGRRGVSITENALNRQVGYQNDLRNIAARMNLTGMAGTAIDQRANERQFGLINAARGDLGASLAREKARLTDVEARISQDEQTTREEEREAQYKLFSAAAASGNVSQVARMTAKGLRRSLTNNLANFQRERQQTMRDRQQADQDYQTNMRELQEREATAVDAREKLSLRRQMQDLEEEQQRRQYQERLADIEDRKKQNMLELMTIELQRKQQVGELGVSRQKTEAERLQAFFERMAAEQRVGADRLTAATQQNAIYQMYPAPTSPRSPNLLPPRNSGRSAGRAANQRAGR